MPTMSKRKYTRRSEEERIEDLQKKINEIQQRIEAKRMKESPVLKAMGKVRRALKRFAQTAQDHGRADLALSTEAFAAGLERAAHSTEETPRRRPKGERPALTD